MTWAKSYQKYSNKNPQHLKVSMIKHCGYLSVLCRVFLKMLGWKRFIHLLFSLIPGWFTATARCAKLVLMVEFNGQTENEVREKIKVLHRELKQHRARYEINGFEEDATEGKSEKFWVMRRQSFQLLRSKVKDKHTAPFIDDLVVSPPYLVEFLPQLQVIIKKVCLVCNDCWSHGRWQFPHYSTHEDRGS